MADLDDGDSVEVKGSGSAMYTLRNTGGVYSCTCPAWRNQGVAIEKRSCKHLRAHRGDEAEHARVGSSVAAKAATAASAAKKGKEPPLLLADKWDNERDLRGWWMSEKLDGVRAYWDGKGLWSRLGNTLHAPDWFLAELPADLRLDGELWVGRRKFRETISIVKRQDKSDLWKQVRYLVFDAPALEGPFEDRVARVKGWLEDRPVGWAEALAHEPCEGIDHLRARLAEVEAQGGEGLMMREPGSRYVVGRSGTLLKVKTFLDSEAVVVDYVAGKGRHKGTAGALVAELPDGKRFSVGTGLSDAERRDPPPIGSVITFRYQELTDAGVPRFPSYVGLRIDVAAPVKKAAPAKAAPKVAAPAGEGARYFELVDGKSSKFWEITVDGSDHTVRYGRIGASGQSQTKSFGSPAKAAASAAELIESKVAKGYQEVAR